MGDRVARARLTAAPQGDHALLTLNILPPGQGANTPDLTSQISMYDGPTPLQGNVTARDLRHTASRRRELRWELL
jgi:hypothetical protein